MTSRRLSISPQEGVYAHLRFRSQTPASTKIEHEARIADRIPAESCRSHSRERKVALDAIGKVC
jgi:hypothetical protein